MSNFPTAEPSSSVNTVHATRNPEIKQTLFRFMHLRDVNLSTDETTHSRTTISHANAASSAFLSAIEGLEEPSAIKAALEGAVEAFTPHPRFRTANQINAGMATFSQWLKANKGHLVLSKIQEQTVNLGKYTEAQSIELWDNLIYQTLTNKSVVIRDNILCLLQADHFFNEFLVESPNPGEELTTEQKKLLEKIASSRVLIPPALFPKSLETEPVNSSSTKGNKVLANLVEKASLSSSAEDLEGFIIEIQRLQEVYAKEYTNLYDSAFAVYEQSVNTAFANATSQEDPETGELVYEGLVLPEFTFTPLDPFDSQFLSNNLSPRMVAFFNAHLQGRMDSYSGVLEELEKRLAGTYGKLENIEVVVSKTALYKGTEIETSYLPTMAKVLGKEVPRLENSAQYDFYLTLHHPDADDLVTEILLQIDYAAPIQGELVHEFENTHTYKFSNANGIFTVDESTIITGNYRTTSRQDYAFGGQGRKVGDLLDSGVLPSEHQCYQDAEGNWNCSYDDPNTGSRISIPVPDPQYGSLLDGEPGIISPIYGVRKVGITDFKRVEQELCCYVEGEVSHIENIMAREHKNRRTRNLTQSEVTTEVSSETENEQLTDTTSTSRYELQTEIEKVLEESQSKSYGGSVSVGASALGGNLTTNINAYLNGTHSSSASNVFSQSESFAREVTERALERIVKKTASRRTSRMLREFEEINDHGFDNRKGSSHVTGIYRWVDKLYKNKLVNYGKRLTYEIMVPEPAKVWKELITRDSDKFELTKPTPPLKPNLAPTDISRSNSVVWAGQYGVEVEPCPDLYRYVSRSYSELCIESGSPHYYLDTAISYQAHKSVFNYNDLEIPEGYWCNEANIAYGVTKHGNDFNNRWGNILLLGKKKLYIPDGATPSLGVYNIGELEDYLPVSVRTDDAVSFTLNVMATCTLKPGAYIAWRNQVYGQIMAAYHRKQQEYLDQLAQWEAEKAAYENSQTDLVDFNNNPITNRLIEQGEIKKIVIQMLTSQISGTVIGHNHYIVDPCGKYKVNTASSNLEHIAEMVNFLEKAFDWNLMNYTLHPYYWSGCAANWKKMLQSTSSSDYIFEAFLQSGMASVQLAVRGGYEKAVLFFLDTGRIWKDGDVLVDDLDAVYLSIDRDLEINGTDQDCCECEPKPQASGCDCGDQEDVCVEAQWVSRVPTALTIVQDYAAPLSANGLPCFSSKDPKISYCEDGTPIGSGNSELSPVLEGEVTEKKMLRFSFDFTKQPDEYTTIGEYDTDGLFPLEYEFNGQQITISRDAGWNASDNAGVIFVKLAQGLSSINGVSAVQIGGANATQMNLEFTIDPDSISTVEFKKPGGNYDVQTLNNLDLLVASFDQSSARFLYPPVFANRIKDKLKIGLSNVEISVLLPISRFQV